MVDLSHRFNSSGEEYRVEPNILDLTKKKWQRAEKLWADYSQQYEHVLKGNDPIERLREADAQAFCVFLEHIVTTKHEINCLRTLENLWSHLRAVYRENSAGKIIDKNIGFAVKSFIWKRIPTLYPHMTGLQKPKDVLNPADFYCLLRYIWEDNKEALLHERLRVQHVLLMQISAYCACRPGTIVESKAWANSNEALKYKDFKLFLARDPRTHGHNTFKLEVIFRLYKGRRNSTIHDPPIFTLYPRFEQPAYCPVLLLLSLALADNAFEACMIKEASDIQKLVIPSHMESISLKWKSDMLEIPVFRRYEPTTLSISKTLCLKYQTFDNMMVRSGIGCGFEQRLGPYQMRRCIANMVDQVANEEQRNLIMGHSSREAFTPYRNNKVMVDTQSIFLGNPTNEDLSVALKKMSLTRDTRAPKILGKERSKEIHFNVELQTLDNERRSLHKRLCEKYGRTDLAAGTPLHKRWLEARRKHCNLRQRLRRRRFKNIHKAHFTHNSTNVVDSQLSGNYQELPNEDQQKPFDLPERTQICALFFIAPLHTTYQNWWNSIQVMVKLCHRKTRQVLDKIGYIFEDDIDTQDFRPFLECNPNQCIFCLEDKSICVKSRTHVNKRDVDMRKHVRRVHLRYVIFPLACPHPECVETSQTVQFFYNHVERVHKIRLAIQ